MHQTAQFASRESSPVSRRTALAGFGGGAALAAVALLGTTPGVSAQSGEATPEGHAGGNYLVIRHYQLVDGVDSVAMVQQIQDEFVPIIREVPGFVAYYYLHDDDAGTAASISIFTDQAGSEESTQRAASWVEESFQGFYQGPPEVTAGTLGITEIAT